MPEKKYRLVLFDADGTLLDYEKTEEHALEAALGDAGLRFLPETHIPAYREINKQFWEKFEKGLVSASELRVERFRKFFAAVGIEYDPAVTAKVYVSHLADSAFLFEDSLPILEYLRPKYKLGIVTNGLKEVQRSRFSKTPVERYVDCIVVSDEVGVQKPEPAIFDHALSAAGHDDRSTVLMIGDSLTSDIKGGVASGLDTCWFNPGEKRNETDLDPTYEIRKLSELREIL